MMKEQLKNIFKKGTETENNRQEMLALFHKPENEFDVKEILFERLMAEQNISSVMPDTEPMFYRLWKKIEREQRRQLNQKRYLTYWYRIAAVLLLGLLFGAFITLLRRTQVEPAYYAACSPKGSVSQIIMPDSTIVFLNAGSYVRYSMEGKNKMREVYLDGEAWFDVTKNTKKPFIVHTSFYDVRVTGTQFNVKAYESDNELTTTLEKGQILIQSTKKFRLAKDIVVKPGEQVILNKNSKEILLKEVKNTKWFTSWRDNKLIFVNMNLKDLVVLLERKYGIDIEVKDSEILKLHFDGTIKNETAIEFLDIIKHALPIDYRIVGQKIEIMNKN